MAHHSATLKAIRQTTKRNKINSNRRSRVRTFIKRVEKAIEAGDKELAQKEFRTAQSELLRGVTKGVYKKNTAARKLSRLNTRVKNLGKLATKPKGDKETKQKTASAKKSK